MRIGFHNPYFDGLGGGERYTLTLASHWSKNHKTDLFWDDNNILDQAERRFGLDLSRVKTVQNIFRGKNIFRKIALSRNYDIIFFLSDGSIPTSFARKNILHFQVPFGNVDANPLKLMRYQAIVCNSQFTKNHLDRRVSRKARVIYPPVSLSTKKICRKEKIILSVGRFHEAKKQNVLIDAFGKGYKKGLLSGWRLVLAGGLLPADEGYFRALKKQAGNLHLSLLPNISYDELGMQYKNAALYWHATGFGETDPTRMEHFGMSTVEAMAWGCVPVVYSGGGQAEIVEHKKSGFLWKTIDELIDYTVALSLSHTSMQESVVRRAQEFDEKKFTLAYDELLNTIAK